MLPEFNVSAYKEGRAGRGWGLETGLMKARHAAVVAGLAMGLMSGVADAAPLPITYNVDFSFSDASNPPDTAHVTGFVTTDGNTGTLNDSDITAFSISSGGFTTTYKNLLYFTGSALSATNNQLIWIFTDNSNDQFLFSSYQGFVAGFYNGQNQLAARPDNATGQDVITKDFPTGDTFVFGAVVSAPSTVPLPASAPMFGAALIALGAVGYGLKRKRAAAA